MPLVVKELIVRATVKESSREINTNDSMIKEEIHEHRHAIIQDAVEQVMEIMERQKER